MKIIKEIIKECQADKSVAFYLILVAVIIGWFFVFMFNQFTHRPQSYRESPTSRLYDCQRDCSGHEAGYEWAKQKHITDPENCGGKSRSFIEGCRAYATDY